MTGIWLEVKEGKSSQNHKDLQPVFELYLLQTGPDSGANLT